ncbi:MAG: VWA domain-containing protein [Myxococcales bacterium]|nr:VWA domain-containing protein [Myxococcales bacterium]
MASRSPFLATSVPFLAAVVLSPLAGCQEYNLQGPETVVTSYNPPDLEVSRREDRVTQVTVPAVDVLFVVDNSGSMIEEQDNLRQNFEGFMSYFTDSGLDYHVGVVSTDMDDRQQSGKLQDDDERNGRYIDNTYSGADAVASFRQRAALGTNGSSDERGKDAAYTALTTEVDNTNAGFYREDAVLSIVVISDEVDYSRKISTLEFISWMNSLKPEDDQAWFSSIVGPAPRGCSSGAGNAEQGVGYLEVTDGVGGISYSICQSDYSSVLEELGMQAAGLKREFFLSEAPVPDTIAVSVNTEGDREKFADDAWTYSDTRNSITFSSYVPEPLAVVLISYETLSDAQAPERDDAEDTAGE